MAGWEDLEQALPLEKGTITQKKDDLDRVCLKVLGSEEGQKIMKWLREAVVEQPVALPGSDPSYAFYREGQNSIVKELEARLIRARKL
jgi:hypothetical protein